MSTIPVDCHPSGRRVLVAPGTLLIDAVQRAGLPLAAACDRAGGCGRCVVQVRGGADGLTAPDPVEERRLAEQGRAPGERLACRAAVVGPVTVTTTYW